LNVVQRLKLTILLFDFVTSMESSRGVSPYFRVTEYEVDLSSVFLVVVVVVVMSSADSLFILPYS
jgi:hypothetical protein